MPVRVPGFVVQVDKLKSPAGKSAGQAGARDWLRGYCSQPGIRAVCIGRIFAGGPSGESEIR